MARKTAAPAVESPLTPEQEARIEARLAKPQPSDTWNVEQTGPVPSWVTSLYGETSKAGLIRRYGEGATFTKTRCNHPMKGGQSCRALARHQDEHGQPCCALHARKLRQDAMRAWLPSPVEAAPAPVRPEAPRPDLSTVTLPTPAPQAQLSLF